MYIYNTLTHSKEAFVALTNDTVKIYSCGPTVYRYIHIGNLRTFCMSDWLRRVLMRRGYEVLHVKNITDVGHMRVELLDRGEDKLIAQARKEGKSSAEIAAFYSAAFMEDERRLNILPAHVFPRATEHIPEMLEIIQTLFQRGMAYQAAGNLYFDVSTFPDYGRLSGNQIATLLAGVRDSSDPHKRHPEDFALWKAAEPGREMAWESPWGRGFPGWHIECSAMSIRYLGQHFDIHTGGVDNIFPHHEDEIAQSEAYTGKPWVHYWVHAQHLLADGLKMAKSTGNAYTRADIEARGFEPLALRYLYAITHYRSRLNFTFRALRAAQQGLQRLRLAVQQIERQQYELEQENRGTEGQVIAQDGAIQNAEDYSRSTSAQHYHTAFDAALDDDLNLPRALAVVWALVRRAPQLAPAQKLALLRDFDQVLGFDLFAAARAQAACDLPQQLLGLLEQREQLRQQQRYGEADALRSQIQTHGYAVRDTTNGPQLLHRAADQEFVQITHSSDILDGLDAPDQYQFSINLIAHDNREDLQRCIEALLRYRAETSFEIVVLDNGSTDDTLSYLQALARTGLCDSSGRAIELRILFADHNLGFAAGRNASMRASRGQIIVLLDTSIELKSAIWEPLAQALAHPEIGLVGPYGLLTADLKEFTEQNSGDVDAIEGYLMAFRRTLLEEIGWMDERFRFYRLLDIHTSFFIKAAGYRVVALAELAACLIKHPHWEWSSLSDDERMARSKKNFDIYYRRWHHGQSLMACNYTAGMRWFGHSCQAGHVHSPEELPPQGQPHSHTHQHWADHAHSHSHCHDEQANG